MNNILKALEKHRQKEILSFHMPGHKSKNIEMFHDLKKHLLSYDVTELSDTDDLYNSHQFLDTFHEKLASFAHAKESFSLTNGSTCGILSAIFALTDFHDVILLERNTHKSVYHACELRQLQKMIIENPSPTLPISEEEYIDCLKKNPSIRLVVITRPNYFGYAITIERLAEYCHANDIFLLVDEAHGSHFALPYFPNNAMQSGADVAINSYHKTLPSLTQASVIHFRTAEISRKVRSMIEYFQSSSPSYLLMASLEIGLEYVRQHHETYLELFDILRETKEKINQLEYFSLPETSLYYQDPTRLCIRCNNPKEVQSFLEDRGIFIEMISEDLLVFIVSIVDTKKDLALLYRTLAQYVPMPIRYSEGWNWKTYIGKVAAENVIVYPPGFVLIEKGTQITCKHIEKIIQYQKQGIQIYTDFSKQIGKIIVEGEKL